MHPAPATREPAGVRDAAWVEVCRRVALDDASWLDVHEGELNDHEGLLDQLMATTPWEQETITLFGRSVQQPRLTAWFGVGMDSTTRYRTSRPALPWPPSLKAILERLQEHTGVDFNSALANLYRDGMDSVAWHADDEPALGRDPVIASVSLGSTRRFLLRRRDRTRTYEVALRGGDLLVMAGATQRLWLHSIPRTRRPTGPRINLTFRAYDVDAIRPPAATTAMLPSGPVVIADYDPAWIGRFEVASRTLRRALGDLAVRVDHIGSTAVPGLAAKPVIDMQVSVKNLRPLDIYRDRIEALGYVHRPHPEVPDREFFRPPGRRTVHLHVVEVRSVCETEHLLVRDFLRAHSAATSRYAALKRELASQHRDSRQDYQGGKDGFLQELLLEAKGWAARTGWQL